MRAEAVRLLEDSSPQAIERFVPRLRAVCLGAVEVEAPQVASLAIVRVCLPRAVFDDVLALAEQMSFNAPLFQAIEKAADQAEVWPLVQALLPAHEARLEQVLAKVVQQRPARFTELPPAVAMKTAFQLGVWKRASLAPFAAVIIATYLDQSGETKEAAGHALRLVASQSEPISIELLETRLLTQRGEEARLLAWVLGMERLKRKQDLEALLVDPRVPVRLGAVDALARSDAGWSRLLRAALDPHPEVRARVLEFSYPGIEEGKPFDEALGRELIAAERDELSAFVSFVATKYPALEEAWLPVVPPSALRRTLEAKATRACARCRSLPREKRWSHSSDAPRQLSALESVSSPDERTTLLRCPDCAAHFLQTTFVEVDVNSRHEDWTLRRLKLAELKLRKDFDASHPRVASWEEALREDLHHVEPAVRAEAKWELEA